MISHTQVVVLKIVVSQHESVGGAGRTVVITADVVAVQPQLSVTVTL
jgi:hypothetical protein